MIYDARESARIRNPVLLISMLTWVLLLFQPGRTLMIAHCPAMVPGAMPFSTAFQMLLAVNPPASLATGWVLMLVAMMSPVLIPPLVHIRLRSFTQRRNRSIAFFITGYAIVWMALGGLLLAIEITVKLFAPQPYLFSAGVALIALVWQSSPIKQRCLNRCHAHAELAAFGVAADWGALRFGTRQGIWCAGSCWALMLFPMLLSRGHFVAMAAVAVLIFCERLEFPRPPCWRWRGPNKAIRILIAQARIRFHAFQLRPAPLCSSVEPLK